MTARKTKDVVEMLGEFLREAAVLVPVFFLLEYAIKYDGKLTFNFVLMVMSLSLLLLTLELFAKRRGNGGYLIMNDYLAIGAYAAFGVLIFALAMTWRHYREAVKKRFHLLNYHKE